MEKVVPVEKRVFKKLSLRKIVKSIFIVEFENTSAIGTLSFII